MGVEAFLGWSLFLVVRSDRLDVVDHSGVAEAVTVDAVVADRLHPFR